MQLKVESDASYLVVKGAKSRISVHFYLKPKYNYFNTHTECATLKNVVSSAAEAECGGLFKNCQKELEIKRALKSLGHLQKQIEIKT